MRHDMHKELPRPLLKRMRLAYDGYQCTACKATQNLTIHHIVPKEIGGKDTLENTVIRCRACHIQLHAKMKTEMKRNKGRLKEIKAHLTAEELYPKQDIEAILLFFMWVMLICEQNLDSILNHPYAKHVRSWGV